MRNTFKLLFFCGLLLTSCSSDDEPAPVAVGEVEFFPEETDVWTGSKALYLNFETTEIFPCVNYPLIVTESFSEETLTVEFLRVGQIVGCYTALGPAKTQVVLPEDTKLLKLVQIGQTDQYEVSITGEKVELKMLESNFSILEQELLLRSEN